MEHEEIRKAGDYTVINAIHIGDRELILGEMENAPKDNTYLVAYCQHTDLFERYEECLVSDDFIEIAEIYAEKLTQQVQQVKAEHDKVPEDKTAITFDSCVPMHECESIENCIVVVRPSVLHPEHRIPQKQIYLAKSGNGIKAHSLGTAVYCDNLYTGKHTRFERYDFMGILNPEHYPEWVKDKIKDMPNLQKQKKDKEVER